MKTALLTAFGVFLVAAAASAQAGAGLGTWKLNLAKSTYDPGPPPKSETRTYVASGHGVKATIERVAANGSRAAVNYTAEYDGKDYPLIGAPEGTDTIAIKTIDANTTEATLKKAGKIVSTNRTVISKDGKTRTQTSDGTTADGKRMHNVLVFDKQ